MKNSKGFSLIEVLIAFGLVTMLVITIFPVSIQIKREQQKLTDRIMISTTLYDELQRHIWGAAPIMPLTYEKKYKNKYLYFHFTTANDLIKGCVEWTNVKHETEKTCLYGYPG